MRAIAQTAKITGKNIIRELKIFLKSGFKVGIDYWFRLKNTSELNLLPNWLTASFKSENIHALR